LRGSRNTTFRNGAQQVVGPKKFGVDIFFQL
jgi:hypothetical protein